MDAAQFATEPAYWQPWFMGLLIVVLILGLARGLAPPDVLMVSVAVTAGLVGIIPVDRVFAGFANTGMLTVAALYVVAAGMRETGVLNDIGRRLLGKAKTEKQVVVRLAGSVTVMSAFLNNTPIVAMFIPILSTWCKNNNVSVSRVLMPLSYLTILGGTCTLIGTSTNLLLSGLTENAGMEPIGMFELSWVGVPYAFIGSLYLYFIGSRLLPERKDLLEQLDASRREYLVNMRVEAGCHLAGQGVEEAGLRRLPGLFLIEIGREHKIITPVRPDEQMQVGDVLTFTGVVDTIVDLERIPGLAPVSDEQYEQEAAKQRERLLHEAVISTTSPLIGKTIRDADFRAQYNAAVLAVHRGGGRLKGRVGDIRLESGDTLLLQTGPHFARAHRNNPDFYLISEVEDSRALREDKALLSLGLLVGLIVLLATGWLPTVIAAFLVAGLMLAFRCVSPNVARQSLDWQTLITIAAAFGVSEALQASGLVGAVAGGIGLAETFGPVGILLAVYLLTSLFTELVTNNAAAAIMFPFTLAIADGFGIDPRPLIMATALVASASFVTPIGYQTNLMVYGPGGYRFGDFVRVGLPLNLVLVVVAVLLIPRIWPF